MYLISLQVWLEQLPFWDGRSSQQRHRDTGCSLFTARSKAFWKTKDVAACGQVGLVLDDVSKFIWICDGLYHVQMLISKDHDTTATDGLTYLSCHIDDGYIPIDFTEKHA